MTPRQTEFINAIQLIRGSDRNGASKSESLIGGAFSNVIALAQGQRIDRIPSTVEIHCTNRCQYGCVFCRQTPSVSLRPEFDRRDTLKDKVIPLRLVDASDDAQLTREQLLTLIHWICAKNPNAFVRLSGTVGDPLVHPAIAEAFALLNSNNMRWGLTTNGLWLRQAMPHLLSAQFAHISLDAGSDDMYQKLKSAKPRWYWGVIANIERLANHKVASGSQVHIIVSLLLQAENYNEIPRLDKLLRSIGANTFEIKMQHFDEHRVMSESQVKEAFELVRGIQEQDRPASYRIVTNQTEAQALAKVHPSNEHVQADVCYSAALGNCTITATGKLAPCCHYFYPTIGDFGSIEHGVDAAWQRGESVLKRPPRSVCTQCAPSDARIISFVEMVKSALDDATFLEWAQARVAAEGHP